VSNEEQFWQTRLRIQIQTWYLITTCTEVYLKTLTTNCENEASTEKFVFVCIFWTKEALGTNVEFLQPFKKSWL